VGLALPAGAARPRAGAWSGETEQGHALGFGITSGKKRVVDLRVRFRARCRRGPAIDGTTTFAGPYPVRGGRFRVNGGELRIRGTFTKRGKATGTLRWEGRSYRPSGSSRRCDSGPVRWQARRR
jgi:hypothetical protein